MQYNDGIPVWAIGIGVGGKLNAAADGFTYGPSADPLNPIDADWRIGKIGTQWTAQRYELGAWVTKAADGDSVETNRLVLPSEGAIIIDHGHNNTHNMLRAGPTDSTLILGSQEDDLVLVSKANQFMRARPSGVAFATIGNQGMVSNTVTTFDWLEEGGETNGWYEDGEVIIMGFRCHTNNIPWRITTLETATGEVLHQTSHDLDWSMGTNLPVTTDYDQIGEFSEIPLPTPWFARKGLLTTSRIEFKSPVEMQGNGNVGDGTWRAAWKYTTVPTAMHNIVSARRYIDGESYTEDEWLYDDETSEKIYLCNTTGVQTGTFASNSAKWNLLGVGTTKYLASDSGANVGGPFPSLAGGVDNTAVGDYAGNSLTSGIGNVAVGAGALQATDTGSYNIAVGFNALVTNVIGADNVAIGKNSLKLGVGSNNIAVGKGSMSAAITAGNNIAIGRDAGNAITSGTLNVVIGDNAQVGGIADTNSIVIGSGAIGDSSNSVVIGNSDIQKTILKGKLGLGTVDPQVALHMVGGSGSTANVRLQGFGVVSQPRLELIRSNGTEAIPIATSPGTILGELWFGGHDGTSEKFSAGFYATASDTFTSTVHGTDLIFQTTPAGTNNLRDVLFIHESGKVTVLYDLVVSGQIEGDGGALSNIPCEAIQPVPGNESVYLGRGGNNYSGRDNVAIGQGALIAPGASTDNNVAIGRNALSVATLDSNTAVGTHALYVTTTGQYNAAFGVNAGSNVTTGSNNTCLGTGSQVAAGGNTNSIAIGHNVIGLGDNTVILGNSSITKTRLQGDVGIGTNSPERPIHIASINSSMFQERYNTGSGSGAGMNIRKSKGATVGSMVAVVAGDHIGAIGWQGAEDGTNWSANLAQISAYVGVGAFNATSNPGEIRFKVCPDGSTVAVDRMMIGADGTVTNYDFTKLGSDAPEIKQKKLTGTTAATEGGLTSVATGIDPAKIIGMTTIVNDTPSSAIPPSVADGIVGVEYYVTHDATNATLNLHPTNSESILSKAFTILITYEA